MIELVRLSKRFGSVLAVDRISYQVGRGEIVGLLGPNGAGKTTTMRILTTFLAPTSGRALIAGHNVVEDPLNVRRKVGYLPENVPLYTEMRVKEYLRFRAKLKDVPWSRRRRAVSEVISRCGLGEMEDRVIGHLSRGYRQRVGLADAMVHDPAILILDEPTSGLDPVQILDVRALIRELGDRQTVLLSTHILPEVEAVCQRAIIISRGRIVVDESLESLRQDQTILVQARGPADTMRNALQSVDGVRKVRIESTEKGVTSFHVMARDGVDPREAICQRLTSNGWMIRELERKRSSLEDRFVEAVAGVSSARPESEVS